MDQSVKEELEASLKDYAAAYGAIDDLKRRKSALLVDIADLDNNQEMQEKLLDESDKRIQKILEDVDKSSADGEEAMSMIEKALASVITRSFVSW